MDFAKRCGARRRDERRPDRTETCIGALGFCRARLRRRLALLSGGARDARMLGISARAFAFAGVALVGAAALGFFHVGPNGALMAAIGVGAGALFSAAVLGVRPIASSIDQTGG